jgi:hypothetical protein
MCRCAAVLCWCVLACSAAPGQETGEQVLLDTSPRLTVADLLHIEQNIQFCLGTWLTEREREILLTGVLGEWLACDRDGRGQMLEFAASAVSLGGLSPEGAAGVREGTLTALRRASEAGRPLGRAVTRIDARVTGVLRTASPRVTEHDGEAWLESQEWALSLLVGSTVRVPDELGRKLIAAACAARPEELAGSAERWARLRQAAGQASPEALRATREALAKPTEPPAATGATLYADPLGLWAATVPEGYGLGDGAGANAEGQTFTSADGARILAVGLGAVPPDVVAGNRPLASALEQTLKTGGAFTEPVPRAQARALGVSALIERAGKTVLICQLRAPGDTALVTVAAIAPTTDLARMLPDAAQLLGSFVFTGGVWEGQRDWAGAQPLARPGESPAAAGGRELRHALEEALGLLAVRVVGAPLGGGRLAFDEALAMLGGTREISVLECPRADARGLPGGATPPQ